MNNVSIATMNGTSIRPCHNRGIFCPKFIISYGALVCRIFFTTTIVYLSIAKVADGFYKTFTLNIFGSFILLQVLYSARVVYDVMSLYEQQNSIIWDTFFWLFKYNELVAAIWFSALALFAIVISYLAYAMPLYYNKNINNRSLKYDYIMLHAVTHLFCFALFLAAFIQANANKNLFSSKIFVVSDIIYIILTFVTLAVTVKAVLAAYAYKNNSLNAAMEKLQHKRLIALILYSIPINLFCLPFLVNCVLHTWFTFHVQSFFPVKTSGLMQLFRITFYITNITNEYRTTITAIVTLATLRPYRQAMMEILCRKKPDSVNAENHVITILTTRRVLPKSFTRTLPVFKNSVSLKA